MRQFLFITILLAIFFPIAGYAGADHIVISEIQSYGQTATDEFVRLYNPTGAAIDISGWRLTKKTSSGSESNLVSAFPDGTIIPPNSGFLIAHQTGYQGGETPSARYSGASYSFADNNTVILKDASLAVIDKVGFGAATDFESAPAPNPEPGKSIKRINNQDTNNNKNDFSADAAAPAATAPDSPTASITSFAEYGDIVINELAPNPADGPAGSGTSKEWIELYNTTAAAINLTGWKISDGATVIYEAAGEIAAGGFFIIEINNRLNNSGDAIYLADGDGKSIFQLAYGDWLNAKIPAPKKGESIARDPAGNYQISAAPTKNAANQFTKSMTAVNNFVNSPDSSAASGAEQNPDDIKNYIIIAEILSNPADSDTDNEYIKLFNSGENDFDLGGFYLDDAEGGSPPYRIPAGTIIKAENFLIFYRTKTKIALNNTEDSARLLAPDKKEILNIAYEDAKEGAIYYCQNEKCGWINSVIARSDSGEAIPSKNYNTAAGIVVAAPGLFGKQIAYINGLQLYMHSADWPELAPGDKISVFGEPSTYYNEPRLKLKNKNSIAIISRNNNIAPEKITSEDIGDDNVGRLITLEGEIIEKTSKKITLDSNGIEIVVYNKNNLPLPDLKEKDIIKISGILSKYKDDFRILPRDEDDFEIIRSAGADANTIDKTSSLWQYIASTLTIGAFAGGIYWRKRKNETNASF